MMAGMMVTATVQFVIEAHYDEYGELTDKYFKQLDAVLEDIQGVSHMDGVMFLGIDVTSEDEWEGDDAV
jgi:hypothetical protein